MKLRHIYEHPSVDGALIGHQSFTIERAPDAGDEPIIWYRGNTNDEDRYGTIVEPSGAVVEPYMASGAGSFLYAHDYAGLPVGKTLELKQKAKSLDFRVRFAIEIHEQARIVYLLARDGYLPATSIGFIPLKWEDYESKTLGDFWGENRRYLSWELLELSAVPVPANRYALKNALDKRVVTENELRLLPGLDTIMRNEAPYIVRATPPLDVKPEGIALIGDARQGLARIIADAVARGAVVKQKDETRNDDGATPKPEAPKPTPPTIAEYVLAFAIVSDPDRAPQAERDAARTIVSAFESTHTTDECVRILNAVDLEPLADVRKGAVLNRKNREALETIRELAQQVLDSAAKAEEDAADDGDEGGTVSEEFVASQVANILSTEDSGNVDDGSGDVDPSTERTAGSEADEGDASLPPAEHYLRMIID